tara:strand:+ start:362 stop:847 length:486 start_codon:yes stop_codon:yes gene_type:complete
MLRKLSGYSYAELAKIIVDTPESNWKFNHGYPQTEHYHDANTEHYSLYGVAPPSIKTFADKRFSKWSVAILEQRPGMVIPLHQDTYYKFKQQNDAHGQEVVRYNVFLDDWHPGHYMEVNAKPIVEWRMGDLVRLTSDIPHRTGNIGTAYKYTCQITGVERG